MYKNRAARIESYLIVLAFMLVAAGCSLVFTATQPTSAPTPAATETVLAATPAPAVVETVLAATPSPAVPVTPVSAVIAPPAAPLAGSDFSNAIRLVAQKAKPAVVQITNEQVQVDQFNQPFDIPAGVGSGVIYDQQGHILTNNHVVEGAQKLLVALPDGRSFQAKLIGRDPMTDLAVVQISGSNLPVADLGDSSQLQVGDWVVAIGNALALDGGPTVTAGVVSALGRTVQEPSDTSALGISDIDLNASIAAQLGITEKEGIIIRRVGRGSPADQAGLQRLDVITAVDGQVLSGDSDLQRILREHKPGDTLTLSVIRENQKLTVKVVVGQAPSP